MRHLAIGDIHGCFTALSALAAAVPFKPDDVLITLGDYVDKGPDTFSVLEWLIRRQKSGTLIALKGNHEILMLAARNNKESYENWLHTGGKQSLASYAPAMGDHGKLVDVPDHHWAFLANDLRSYFELDGHFFVHANAYADLPLSEQPDYVTYWEGFDDPPPHESGKVMVCGHTRQKSGVPKTVGHAICIDTGVAKGGWLTCFNPATGEYWQANENRKVRKGWMDDLE